MLFRGCQRRFSEEDLILHALGRQPAKGICPVYHWCQATGAWVALGGSKQAGKLVPWDRSSSHAWGGVVREHSRGLEQTPAAGHNPGFRTQCGRSRQRPCIAYRHVLRGALVSTATYLPHAYALPWHLLLAILGDGTDGRIVWPRKIFLCLYAVFYFLLCMCPKHCKM